MTYKRLVISILLATLIGVAFLSVVMSLFISGEILNSQFIFYTILFPFGLIFIPLALANVQFSDTLLLFSFFLNGIFWLLLGIFLIRRFKVKKRFKL